MPDPRVGASVSLADAQDPGPVTRALPATQGHAQPLNQRAGQAASTEIALPADGVVSRTSGGAKPRSGYTLARLEDSAPKPSVRQVHPGPGQSSATSPGTFHVAGPRHASTSQSQLAEEFIRALAAAIGPECFERYFAGQTRVVVVQEDAEESADASASGIEVRVASSYTAAMIERRFASAIRQAASERGVPLVRVVVDRAARANPPTRQQDGPVGATPQARPAPSGRAPAPRVAFRHSLDDFIVGDANRLPFTAVKRMVEAASPTAPVFVHGACGLGKTHLLQGAAALFQKLHPAASVRYVTGEQFTNDFIQSIKSGRVDALRKTYRTPQLLCIDDVHFLSNKDATQLELMHTFDAVGLAGARLLIASDEHPRDIRKLSDKLTSRFLACAVVKLDVPEMGLRRKLVERVAARRGLALSPEAIELLSQRSAKAIGALGGFGGSIREIEGLLHQLEAVARLLSPAGVDLDAPIDASLVARAFGLDQQQAARTSATGAARRPIPVQAIIEHVCRELAVEHPQFTGDGRHPRVVLARALVVLLARMLTTQSFPEIARAMGRSNHSTVITALRRIEGQLERDDAQSPLDSNLTPHHPGMSLREIVETFSSHLRAASR